MGSCGPKGSLSRWQLCLCSWYVAMVTGNTPPPPACVFLVLQSGHQTGSSFRCPREAASTRVSVNTEMQIVTVLSAGALGCAGGYLLLTSISECRQGKGICRRRNCTWCLGESLHQALSMSKQASEWVKEGLSPDTRPGTRGNHPATVPPESGLMNDKQSHFHGKCWACCFLGKHGDNRNREGFDFLPPVLIWKECLAPCKHAQCF